jgi:hypothetical protein
MVVAAVSMTVVDTTDGFVEGAVTASPDWVFVSVCIDSDADANVSGNFGVVDLTATTFAVIASVETEGVDGCTADIVVNVVVVVVVAFVNSAGNEVVGFVDIG